MSTTTSQILAFRCTQCWQSTCADVEQTGQSVPCIGCGADNLVPEATEKRLKDGEQFSNVATESLTPVVNINEEELTDEQIFQLAQDKARSEIRESTGVGGYPSSRGKRFLGSLIDSFAMMMTCLLGFILAAVLGGGSGMASSVATTALILIMPTMLWLCQVYMTAVDGQTIGKLCLRMKIVTKAGDPPGFVQGVLLRMLANSMLCIIPFYGLVDVLWIFTSDSNKCLHDYVAGTTVVDII